MPTPDPPSSAASRRPPHPLLPWMSIPIGRLRALLGAFFITAFLSWTAAASAAPAEGYGLYEACSPDNGKRCLDRLHAMGAAGFELVVNYNQLYGSAEQILAYADAAHRAGLEIIWNLKEPTWWCPTNFVNAASGRNPCARTAGAGTTPADARAQYASLAKDCAAAGPCGTRDAFLAYVVRLVKDLPATWGYYVGDEPPADHHADLRAHSKRVRMLDPDHDRLLVAWGDPATLETKLAPFHDTADVLAADNYPVGLPGASMRQLDEATRATAAIARRHDKRYAMVLQSFDWGAYPHSWAARAGSTRWPTRDEMRRMRDIAVSRSSPPSIVLWYSYHDLMSSANPGSRWSDLTWATFAPEPSARRSRCGDLRRGVCATVTPRTIRATETKSAGSRDGRAMLLYRLARRARVRIVLERKRQVRSRRCDCRAYRRVGRRSTRAAAGLSRVPLDGLTRGRSLRPGRYRVVVRAGSRAGTARRAVARFRILR